MNAAKRHYWIRTLVLLGFALLLADLLATGDIRKYLAPRFVPLSYVTLAILVVLTGFSLRQALTGSHTHDCGCEAAHSLPRGRGKALLVYGLFALPLLMGFLMPEKALDSELAQKKGVNLLTVDLSKLAQAQSEGGSAPAGGDGAEPSAEGASAPDQEAAEREPTASGGPIPPVDAPSAEGADGQGEAGSSGAGTSPLSVEEAARRFRDSGFGDFYADIALAMYKQPVIQLDDKLFLDGLTTLEIFPQEFAGRKLETMGFVYRQPGLKENQFVVARFSVSCCTADANVMGILVTSPQAGQFANDSWVRVAGTLELVTFEGMEMLVLRADRITPMKAPEDPYVYYSYNNAVNTQ